MCLFQNPIFSSTLSVGNFEDEMFFIHLPCNPFILEKLDCVTQHEQLTLKCTVLLIKKLN